MRAGRASPKQKVVVTGGAGFIGSHLADRLLREGYSVLVIDNFSTGSIGNLEEAKRQKNLRVARADIRDHSALSRLLKGSVAVFHQAALVSVTRSVKRPHVTNDVNVNGTLALLRASVKARVKRFIYASSSSVYGAGTGSRKSENMYPQPISPYGVSKLAAESYCRAFHSTYGLATTCLRYFNVYGPRQRIGPYSGVIVTFLKRVLSGQPPIIYGDGRQTRDFTFVSDVVEANLLALERDEAVGQVFNIARGTKTDINHLARAVLELCGKSHLGILRKPARSGDIRFSCADIGKARRVLGYSPKTDLRKGLKKVMEWMAT